MDIPFTAIVALGFGAVLKDLYRITVMGQVRSFGSLMAVAYLTFVYIILAMHCFEEINAGIFVRIGVLLLFVDKVLVFINDLYLSIMNKRHNSITGVK